jgi:hypothetical protein
MFRTSSWHYWLSSVRALCGERAACTDVPEHFDFQQNEAPRVPEHSGAVARRRTLVLGPDYIASMDFSGTAGNPEGILHTLSILEDWPSWVDLGKLLQTFQMVTTSDGSPVLYEY